MAVKPIYTFVSNENSSSNAPARFKTFIFAAIEHTNLKSSRPVILHIPAATGRLAHQSASRQYVLSFAGIIQNGEAL